MSERIRRAACVAAAASLVLVAAACSGDDDAGQQESPDVSRDFVSRPDLTPPIIDVTMTDAGEKALADDDSLVFLAPKDEKSPMNGPMIVDAEGDPVWMHPLGDRWSYDLRVQEYRGEPVLTWWRGETFSGGYGQGEFVIMDNRYREIATYTTPGVHADFHDGTITPQGTALLTSFPLVRHDLSAVGGPSDGYLRNCVVQEVDIETGKVLFRWSALDHIPVKETQASPEDDEEEVGTKDAPFDPYHFNSVTLDRNNGILVSARNTHAIYRIDRRTGELDWTLGGSGSDFEMVGDSEFAWQHDAQRRADGTITLYDNQAAPEVGERSRGLRLDVDTKTDTARVVEEFLPTDDDRLSASQGNMQVRDNGNVVIGWGSEPYYSEYAADGTLLFDAEFAAGISYRAYKFPWTGKPTEPPAFVLDDGTAYVSWNGATEVDSWRFVAGDDRASAKTVETVPSDEFETSAEMPDEPYIAAQALDSSGKVLATARPGEGPATR